MTDFTNRQDWTTAAIGLAVWAAHFMLLWIASSLLPGQVAARWLAAGLTLIALAVLAWLWRRAGSPSLWSAPGLGLALAASGIVYGTIPALVG